MTDYCSGCLYSFFIEDGIKVNGKPFCRNNVCVQTYKKRENKIKKCIVCSKNCKKKDMVRDNYCTEKCIIDTLKCYCGQPVATDSDSIEYRFCDEHSDDI
jgi:hypothetical protein